MKIAADQSDIRWAGEVLNARLDALNNAEGTHAIDGTTYHGINSPKDRMLNGDLFDVPTMNAVATHECMVLYQKMIELGQPRDEDGEDDETQLVAARRRQVSVMIGMACQFAAIGVLMERRRHATENVGVDGLVRDE